MTVKFQWLTRASGLLRLFLRLPTVLRISAKLTVHAEWRNGRSYNAPESLHPGSSHNS